jgi:hypothetical protein
MNNMTAAQSGDRRKALETLRDTLASLLDTTESQVHAQLSAQYRATLAELDELAGSSKKGSVDELKQRRAAKGRGATSDASANA